MAHNRTTDAQPMAQNREPEKQPDATRRCEVCHRVLPLDAFPPDSVICDADYRLVGVDAWEDNDD